MNDSQLELKHHIVSKIHSRDEMMTSDLGLAAYEGDLEQIKNGVGSRFNWEEEGHIIFSSAIMGKQWDVCRFLIKSGLPIRDSIYREIYYKGNHDLLNLLPDNPEVMAQLHDASNRSNFFQAIIDGDYEKVKACFKEDYKERIYDYGHFYKEHRPLHLAARYCHLEIIEFLLSKKVEVNTLTQDGKSPLFLASQCPSISDQRRKKCIQALKSNGAVFVPEIKGFLNRFFINRGGWNSAD